MGAEFCGPPPPPRWAPATPFRVAPMTFDTRHLGRRRAASGSWAKGQRPRLLLPSLSPRPSPSLSWLRGGPGGDVACQAVALQAGAKRLPPGGPSTFHSPERAVSRTGPCRVPLECRGAGSRRRSKGGGRRVPMGPLDALPGDLCPPRSELPAAQPAGGPCGGSRPRTPFPELAAVPEDLTEPFDTGASSTGVSRLNFKMRHVCSFIHLNSFIHSNPVRVNINNTFVMKTVL